MRQEEYPPEFLEILSRVKSKRAATVIAYILEYGHITTENLSELGYNHPPRAARDVREAGIPLETFKVESSSGRKIAAYRFADPATIRKGLIGGRRAFSKAFKKAIVQNQGTKCAICSEKYEERYLQIDHRVPYEVAGDVEAPERNPDAYMLVCGSCNRAKSWSCEHCRNWIELKDPSLCNTCYWAQPGSYTHISLRDVRRLELIWAEDEASVFDALKEQAEQSETPIPEYVKSVLVKHLQRRVSTKRRRR